MSEMQGRIVTIQLDFVLEDFHVIKFKQGSTWNELKLIITNEGQPFELDTSNQYKYRIQGVNPKGEPILIDAETVSGNYLTFKNIDEGITHENGEGTISLSIWDYDNNLINILIENIVLQIIENKFYNSTIYEDNRLQALNDIIFNANTSTIECQNATTECISATLHCESATENCEEATENCIEQTNKCETATINCETLTNLVQLKLNNGFFKGEKGDKGDTGKGFAIIKVYATITEMLTDEDPVDDGDMVAVVYEGKADVYLKSSSTVEDVVLKDLDGYKYVVDLAEASVIKGDKGDKGDTGVVTTVEGQVAFQIENGYLMMYYTGDTAPNYSIDVNGCLILTI